MYLPLYLFMTNIEHLRVVILAMLTLQALGHLVEQFFKTYF